VGPVLEQFTYPSECAAVQEKSHSGEEFENQEAVSEADEQVFETHENG
jgi:hypothetical protein